MNLDKETLQNAVTAALNKTDYMMETLKGGFPNESSNGYVYEKNDNTGGWGQGFWTGILWLAYELSGDKKYRDEALSHIPSFEKRIREKIGVDHHDMGFLYIPSCVADYKLTGNEHARDIAVLAADNLLSRFQEKGGFIQAWGELGAADNYRLIIDTLLNIPLLYWATEVTGDEKYKKAAYTHFRTAMKNVLRADGTSSHTFYFDSTTGAPLKGVTHQGASDNSCWARGQAWGIYGIALNYAYTRDAFVIPHFNRLTDYFISHLGSDNIPYWDLSFTDGVEPRDTSAAAITICGILEMSKHVAEPKFIEAADKMLESLIANYTTKNLPRCNGLLTDAMYSRPHGHNPECNIWGDYFYMEALMRKLNPDWNMYW
jgi:unsaturated chondroitin disaccharide hydrolase